MKATPEQEREIFAFLDQHLRSVFNKDTAGYEATTSEELSLYEWWVTPHRQDGLDFHFFMIENAWAGAGAAFRYDLLEPRVQVFSDTAVVSYTFMLSQVGVDGRISHRTHNESRVLVKTAGQWQVVHVHKSPSWQAPYSPGQEPAS